MERCRLVSKTWQSAVDEYLGKFGQQLKLQHLMEVWSAKEPQMLEMKGILTLGIYWISSSIHALVSTSYEINQFLFAHIYPWREVISVSAM